MDAVDEACLYDLPDELILLIITFIDALRDQLHLRSQNRRFRFLLAEVVTELDFCLYPKLVPRCQARIATLFPKLNTITLYSPTPRKQFTSTQLLSVIERCSYLRTFTVKSGYSCEGLTNTDLSLAASFTKKIHFSVPHLRKFVCYLCKSNDVLLHNLARCENLRKLRISGVSLGQQSFSVLHGMKRYTDC